MKVLLSWLHELLDEKPTAQETFEALTAVGIEVGAMSFLGQGFEEVVTAKILGMRPHPSADRLTLCEVTDGTRAYAIVCGAKNMNVGDVVALGRAGAKLPNGMNLKKSKIRGETSEGMLCSEAELGLSEESEGILILSPETQVGQPLAETLDRNDWLLELELTPNRGDCLSMIGVAREVAAALHISPKLPTGGGSGQVDEKIQAVVSDREGASRYVLRYIQGIEVKESPAWLRHRLEVSGIRAICNGVDITNYVMLEWGQPLHAFDQEKVVGAVHVRAAREGERLLGLDEVERTLISTDLVIADEKGPIALAGVMGGKRTAVGAETTSILLESAHFDPRRVRLTARRLGLRTESSHRFERFVDPSGTWDASTRAANLFVKLAGGKIVSGVDLKADPPAPKHLHLRQETLERILGTEVKEAGECLARLGFTVMKSEDGWSVEVPHRRADIEREIDLVEEVARIHGYAEFESKLPPQAETDVVETSFERIEDIRDVLRCAGLQEVRTHSFSSEADLQAFPFHSGIDPLRLLNPLTKEMSFMRQSLLPNLLEVWRSNFRRQAQGMRMYEIGTVFGQSDGASSTTPAHEEAHLGLLLAGLSHSPSWHQAPRPSDFFDGKGALEVLADQMGWGVFQLESRDIPSFLHPGKAASVYWRNRRVGFLGILHPAQAKAWDIESPMVAEIDLSQFLENGPQVFKFKPISQFPLVRRDLAFWASKEIVCAQIMQEVKQLKEPLLSRVELFDLYDGKGAKPGCHSLAYTLSFEAVDRTLTDAEVDASVDRIVTHLSSSLGLELRS